MACLQVGKINGSSTVHELSHGRTGKHIHAGLYSAGAETHVFVIGGKTVLRIGSRCSASLIESCEF